MKQLTYILILCLCFTYVDAQEIIVLDTNYSLSEKEALVILNGFGDSRKNRKIQKEFFRDKGYDLFIPEYVNRRSMDMTIKYFSNLYDEYNLDEYKEVKFLCYIVGGYVLNEHIQTHGSGRITTIIYDRSPIQERAPKTVIKRMKIISQMIYGRVLYDFSKLELYSLGNKYDIEVGIIIESKATRLMRYFRKTSDSYGSYTYVPEEIDANQDDFMYTYLDHNMMYERFDVIGEDILHFLEFGRFTNKTRRIPYNWDPFEKIKKNDINL